MILSFSYFVLYFSFRILRVIYFKGYHLLPESSLSLFQQIQSWIVILKLKVKKKEISFLRKIPKIFLVFWVIFVVSTLDLFPLVLFELEAQALHLIWVDLERKPHCWVWGWRNMKSWFLNLQFLGWNCWKVLSMLRGT